MRIFDVYRAITVTLPLFMACVSSHDEDADIKSSVKSDVENKASQDDEKLERRNTGAITMSQFEYKLAKLWAKVEEQEIRLARQNEQLQLLEKGLMLGVVPPEILQQYGNPDQKIPYKSLPEGVTEKALKPSLEEKQKSLASEKQASTPEKENESALLKKSHPDDSEYIELLKVAQEKFNQGSYGQAIAEYQRLSETFPELIKHGQHLYWIGLSWFYLKEDRMASDAFNDLQKNYPQSPFVGRSSLYLARIDARSGLRKRALDRLRRIIQEFPSDEVAEMARFELERMKEGI